MRLQQHTVNNYNALRIKKHGKDFPFTGIIREI